MGTSRMRGQASVGPRALVLVSLVTIVTLLVGASPASANTSRRNTDTFSRSGTFLVPTLQTCLHYAISGRLTYTAKRFGPNALGQTEYRLVGITVVAPKMTLRATRFDPGSHACTSRPDKWTKAAITQGWAGYSCTFNPQMSVSLPFGLSVGFWPSCGNRKAARYRSSFGRLAAVTQFNSAARVRFPGQNLGLKPAGTRPSKPRCFGVVGIFQITRGGTSDTPSTGRRQLCPTPVF